MSHINIRMATIEDAKEINQIYEKYILETAITFEYDPVPLSEFEKRIQTILTKLPYLVCEVDDCIAGYAYVAPFKTRAAFAWDVEITVYLHSNYYRRNIGRGLYEAIFEIVKKLGYINIYALITDENEISIKMHEAMGFHVVGYYPETGYKFNQWWGLYVLHKRLSDRLGKPEPIKSLAEIDKQEINYILTKMKQYVKE